jgi:hypothetical protein
MMHQTRKQDNNSRRWAVIIIVLRRILHVLALSEIYKSAYVSKSCEAGYNQSSFPRLSRGLVLSIPGLIDAVLFSS